MGLVFTVQSLLEESCGEHRVLFLWAVLFMLFEAGEWSKKSIIRKGGKAGNAQINAKAARVYGFSYFLFRLDGDKATRLSSNSG